MSHTRRVFLDSTCHWAMWCVLWASIACAVWYLVFCSLILLWPPAKGAGL